MEHQVKAYAFIAPSLLILTVFVFIPLAGAIGISLMNIDIYMKNISFAGIANYIKMFQDERVANATFHTFYFALLEVPLQMIVALLLLMFMLRNTKTAQAFENRILPALCVFYDGSQHHVVDAAQYALRNAAISAWKNRYHDAKHALKYDMGDAYGDFCYGVERVRIYAYHPFGGGARRL